MKYKFAGSVISASYSYDETKDNLPDGASFDGAGKVGYVYDSLGRTKQYGVFNKNNAGVYSASYTYKKNPSDSSKTSGVVEKINYGSINVKALSYGYDKNGNITSISDSSGDVYEKYSYDNLNQLSTAYSGDTDNQYFIKYTYDTAGNILSKKYYDALYYSTKDESLLKSTINYTYDSTWKDKLVSYNGKSISYDAIGNMLSFDSQTFTWLGRRLNSYAKGGTTTNYTYNSDGIRTKKVSGSATTDYCLNGAQILAEKRGGTLINYFYTSDGTRVGFKTGGKVYYYVYNLQGDVTHIVDESKNIVATYRYDPFGKILNLSSLTNIGKLNPFRYRGYYYDTESGLYYVSSRYYNPEVGRYLNADGYVSTGQGILGNNMFAYCGNNPVNNCDPSGQFFISALLVGGLVLGSALLLSGCSAKPTSDVGAAKPYVDMPGSDDPTSPNCYAYAISSPVNEQPGGTSGRIPKKWSDVNDVGKSVEADLKAKGHTVREISGPDAKVYDNEFKIALRVGTQPYAYNQYTGQLYYDYHFMRQTSTGQWAEKHGYGGASILWDAGMTPDTIPWTLGGVPYYDSAIIYYAVGN